MKLLKKNLPSRVGTKKDGDDLKAVLKGLKFNVRYYVDLKLNDIQNILYNGNILKIQIKIILI